jgi:hypothetical protein
MKIFPVFIVVISKDINAKGGLFVPFTSCKHIMGNTKSLDEHFHIQDATYFRC